MPTPAVSPPLNALNGARRHPSCPDLAGISRSSIHAHPLADSLPTPSPSPPAPLSLVDILTPIPSPDENDDTSIFFKPPVVKPGITAPVLNTPPSTTVEPEASIDNSSYHYPPSNDLGYIITRSSALTLSDEYSTRKRSSHLSSLFRPGSRFTGTQTDKHTYSVQVTIQQMDMSQSTLCGYLQIDGLTSTLPSMTTYFDGEIVGPHFSFITSHEDWGASAKTDLAHWSRFPAFKSLAKTVAADPDYRPQNITQREYVFMRWKERFLVPDHRLTEVRGASYAGFYYVCFHQKTGALAGVYFHEEHDRYQSLSLKHVQDRGVMAGLRWN